MASETVIRTTIQPIVIRTTANDEVVVRVNYGPVTTAGTGDVGGPASATDNAIVRFNGPTGKSVQDSGITIADGASGTLSGTNSGDVTLAGENYLSIANQVITAAAVNLAGSNVTGTLPVGKIPTAIPATSIANGSVSNTEFQYLDGVTSAIQGQIDGKQTTGNYITALTGEVTAAGPGSAAATIANNAITTIKILDANVTLAKIANASANSKLIGSGAAGSGAPYAEITLGTGLSMSGTTLSSTATGTGDVVGPAIATDGAFALFDGTTGKLIKNSSAPGANVMAFLATPSSANLAAALTDETGTGVAVFNNSPTFADDITVGVQGSATGSILLKGTTSGTVTVKVADAAGTWSLTLPIDDGTNGQILSTNGSGVTSWVDAGSGSGDMLKSTYDPQVLGYISGANSFPASVGGYLKMDAANGFDGGNIWTYSDAASGGSIHMNAGTDTDCSGGNLFTEGGSVAGAFGGNIFTYGGALPGGSIDTSDGGGSIDTRSSGSIQLGASGTRTTILGAAASNWTLTLPTNDGNNLQFLQTNGSGVTTWASAGTGDVVGPGSATDGAFALFDGTTGKLIKNSSAPGANVMAFLATPSSANLAAALTDETGTGKLVFGTNPTFPAQINIGETGVTTGTIALIGTTSGAVNITVANAAGADVIFQLPSSEGSSGQFLQTNGSGVTSWASQAVPTAITVANEATDTTCFPLFATAATGDLGPKSNTGFTFDSATRTLGVGVASGATGKINLLGTTSGVVTVSVADAAGTWTMKLPTTDGNANEFLQTDGNGVCSWAAGGGGITIDTTAITGGTIGNVLYHKSGDVVGEMTTTGTGTVLVLATSPTITTPVCSGVFKAGGTNTATGANAIALGETCTSSGYTSVAMGYGAIARFAGMLAWSGTILGSAGDTQCVEGVLYAATTNATPTEMFGQWNLGERYTLSSNRTLAAVVTVQAQQDNNDDQAMFTRRVLLANDGGTTAIVGSVQTIGTDILSAGAITGTWAVAITADNTNDSILVTVTGEAATNIRWIARISGTEIKY